MRSKIIFYPFVLKAIMVFLTMLLTVGVALMLTPRTDMSEVAKCTVVGIVWLVILYVTSRRFRTIAEGNAPRPWWCMTTSPFLGWAFATFFAAMGIWIAAGSDLLPSNPLLGMVYIMFGGLFVMSALRPPTRRR
ncbi:hypothetical protein [uncultured Corynebacterium sp.]|uniref:hypothetical protein n=1 Tax=uncultured Corynebacterium sp. TaxID=159447 RepID=UPI0028D81A5A|nr:hypothetical protein [uncultured Corynebacterium sp.]